MCLYCQCCCHCQSDCDCDCSEFSIEHLPRFYPKVASQDSPAFSVVAHRGDSDSSIAGSRFVDIQLPAAKSCHAFRCSAHNSAALLAVVSSSTIVVLTAGSSRCTGNITNYRCLGQKHRGFPESFAGPDGTLYPLREKYMPAVIQAMGHVAYLPVL
jgi:hypothetical protein